jgi:2-haloalkanoic acid dehalogenase type II
MLEAAPEKRTPLPKFTHLTFDCYGTLIDWRGGLDSYLGGLLQRKGLQPGVSVYPTYVKLEAEQEGKYKSYHEILHDTAISVANHFNLSITENEAREFAESIGRWKPFEDTVRSLKVLGERGYKRVILSNVDRDLLRETIARNNLDVDGYITAQDVGSYKPSLGHWKRFFEEYKATKRQTLHVAQSIYHDIVPSTQMGVASAWINRYAEEKPAGVDPVWVLPTLTGLLDVLD